MKKLFQSETSKKEIEKMRVNQKFGKLAEFLFENSSMLSDRSEEELENLKKAQAKYRFEADLLVLVDEYLGKSDD